MRHDNAVGKMKYFKATLLVLIYFLMPLSLSAQYLNDEDAFFSYERFYLKAAMLKDVSENRDIRRDVKAFMRNFSDGIYAIAAGDLKKAKTKLLKARAIWPEYFGADFLLARVSEDMHDYNLSAKFYKSYLNKLKALSEGNYRISGPLMIGITPYHIENYDDAYALVRERLKAHDIDLAVVQPYYAMPSFYKPWIIIIMLGLGYAAAAYGVIPHVKRWMHIKNPPQGSWACTKCGAYNLNVRMECEKCGKRIDAALPR